MPLYALIQKRSKRQHLSRIIAANNIINACLMVGASIMSMILLHSGISIPELFLIIAVLNAIVAVYIFSLLPEFLMRFLAWIVISVVYRIRPGGPCSGSCGSAAAAQLGEAIHVQEGT